ncbi:hypothetical protein L226DRAFT_231046 [Lentinus tigrinus ALCF2SS1-7]|uniref:uncharacterized protein n=1 Tax=Lentinus tigrinus ALCF2SS1-7 TaxID=1328758 RepID=UPI001165FBF0|nr:hypothetical protein L226DRAFT_231046 [Lentinus tigrinus ALCF2SS1-7]
MNGQGPKLSPQGTPETQGHRNPRLEPLGTMMPWSKRDAVLLLLWLARNAPLSKPSPRHLATLPHRYRQTFRRMGPLCGQTPVAAACRPGSSPGRLLPRMRKVLFQLVLVLIQHGYPSASQFSTYSSLRPHR